MVLTRPSRTEAAQRRSSARTVSASSCTARGLTDPIEDARSWRCGRSHPWRGRRSNELAISVPLFNAFDQLRPGSAGVASDAHDVDIVIIRGPGHPPRDDWL